MRFSSVAPDPANAVVEQRARFWCWSRPKKLPRGLAASGLLRAADASVQSQERLDKLIVVLDREGYSSELFRHLDGRDEGAGKRRALFISWANYSDKWVNDLAEERFNRSSTYSHPGFHFSL